MPSQVPWPDTLSTSQRLQGRIARLLAGLPGSWLLTLVGEHPITIEGATLDPHVQFVLAMRRRGPRHLLCEPTPVQARRRYRTEIQQVAEDSGARPTRVKSVRTLQVPGADGVLDARLYLPPGLDAAPPPLLVFLHGGGFVLGDLDTHDEPCRILCRESGMAVLSVAYRLAPEHAFPAQVDDATAVLRWAQAHEAELGVATRRTCIGGDSAGACLSISAAITAAREGRRPAGLLLVYPATDFTANLPSRHAFAERFMLTAGDIDAFAALYLGTDPALRHDVRASPALSPELALLPPTFITVAGFDPLRDEGLAFAVSLQRAGVPVRTLRAGALTHGFLHMTTIAPATRMATEATARAFRALIDPANATAPA